MARKKERPLLLKMSVWEASPPPTYLLILSRFLTSDKLMHHSQDVKNGEKRFTERIRMYLRQMAWNVMV
jgi:hypothetical protein